jgi:cystathionine beta-lyase family protein involved in aluminum resistance
MAITGGYVAGRKDMVEGALLRLTAPGIGGHLGITFNQNRPILQGLFLAPSVVSQAVKGAMLVASVFEKLGMIVHPAPAADRYDIIQAVEFGNRERLINFCRALQSFSPVNAHVSPEPSSMPGYADQVVMAGGTFVEGATIELSADGPLRPPFAVYLQGGLSYLHVKCALLGSLNLSAEGVTPFF